MKTYHTTIMDTSVHPGRLTAGTWESGPPGRGKSSSNIIFRFKLLIFGGVHCTNVTSLQEPLPPARSARSPRCPVEKKIVGSNERGIQTTQQKGNTWVAIIVVQHEICIDMLDTFRYNILLYIIEQQGLRNLSTISTNKDVLQYDEANSTFLSCANQQNDCFAKQVLIPLIVGNSPLILLVCFSINTSNEET